MIFSDAGRAWRRKEKAAQTRPFFLPRQIRRGWFGHDLTVEAQ